MHKNTKLLPQTEIEFHKFFYTIKVFATQF